MHIRLIALGMLAVASGCGVLRPGIPGSGIARSELRSVEMFDEVAWAGAGTVNVYPGDVHSVRVTTDDNLVQHVETRVENGVLKIKPRHPISPKSGLTVDVVAPRLSAARVSGVGDLNLTGVSADSLDLSISGAGTLNADGWVRQLHTSISGVGDAELQRLHADHASISISGAGEAHIYAAESIDAQISGIGDIVCYGNPKQVAQRISGLGELTLEESSRPVQLSLGDSDPSGNGVQ